MILKEDDEEKQQQQIVICMDCGEKLEYKMYYAQEHLKKYPNHKRYRVRQAEGMGD